LNKLPDAVTAILETSINRYLALDFSAQDNLNALNNKSVELNIKEISSPVFFNIVNQHVKVLSTFTDDPDVRMTTTVPVLLKMGLSKEDDEALLGGDFEMSGNMDVGRQFRYIFKNVDIDWEEIISKYTGDIVAHKLGNGFRKLNHWLANTKDTIRNDIAEYLQEESRQLPSSREVDDYLQAVDDVRMAVERAEARLKQFSSSQDIINNNIKQ